MSRFDEIYESFEEAQHTLSFVDNLTDKLARMLIGRLRKTKGFYCAKLKKELTQFNSRTYEWKS